MAERGFNPQSLLKIKKLFGNDGNISQVANLSHLFFISVM